MGNRRGKIRTASVVAIVEKRDVEVVLETKQKLAKSTGPLREG